MTILKKFSCCRKYKHWPEYSYYKTDVFFFEKKIFLSTPQLVIFMNLIMSTFIPAKRLLFSTHILVCPPNMYEEKKRSVFWERRWHGERNHGPLMMVSMFGLCVSNPCVNCRRQPSIQTSQSSSIPNVLVALYFLSLLKYFYRIFFYFRIDRIWGTIDTFFVHLRRLYVISNFWFLCTINDVILMAIFVFSQESTFWRNTYMEGNKTEKETFNDSFPYLSVDEK